MQGPNPLHKWLAVAETEKRQPPTFRLLLTARQNHIQ